MNKTLTAAVAAALLGALALAGCKKEQPATPPATAAEPATAPAPRPGDLSTPAAGVAVITVDLGNAVDADNRVIRPATTFATGDTLYASVATRAADATAPARGRLAARWTYQDGQVIDELGQDYRFSGAGHTAFRISTPDGWPTGTYKVEILLDGSVVQTRQFEVR